MRSRSLARHPSPALLALALLGACCASCAKVEDLGPARLGLDPGAIDFGAVYAGDDARRVLVLHNYGGAPIAIGKIEIKGAAASNFAVSRTGPEIPPQDALALTVAFHPESAGDRLAELAIESDAPDWPIAQVKLSGRGLEPRDAGVILDATTTSSDAAAGD